ncbi:peptide deformylase [Oceanispirochaeta crateris]|uniref:Peptide deformylase n=1 Tax=Oceanispirochaeta crateris TaxID=2518645 RepID=A0A5C1QLI7_9SPIO|nr:peptide deformylase [Oceanispirochaeta crateris]QEN07830.1 peptide deformylase [Oceanispirochaeta crateris]
MDIYTIDVEKELEVLRTKSTLVTNIDQELVNYTNQMLKSIEGIGIGLAAPQVGRNERFFVCQVDQMKPLVFINPEIIGTSEELSSYEEGCLSIPGMYGDVKRPAVIQIQAWNQKGRPFKMEAEGLLATCIQHELDHLNGLLFIDYLSDRKREKLLKKYKKSVEDQ